MTEQKNISQLLSHGTDSKNMDIIYAGFKDVTFIYDEAKLFSTVTARK